VSAAQVADALLAAARAAAAELERLDEIVDRAAGGATAPDGTPVADLLEELREARRERATALRLLGLVHAQARRPARERAAAIEEILRLSSGLPDPNDCQF